MADKFMKSITFVEGGDTYYPLPKVTNADDGKVLKVVNGAWRLGEFVVKTLTKIEVTTAPTTVEYTEGDSLDLTGLVVTATFSDGSTEDVTSQCIISPAAGTMLATTDTSISISYTYKGVARSTAQIIVVESAVTPYLSFIGNEDFTLKTNNTTKNWDGTLEYSTDTSTWNTWSGTEISSVGSKLYLRGTGNTKITGNSNNYRFVFTGTNTLKIACEGNIENLLDYEIVSSGGHPTMASYCYAYMFGGCTSLTAVPSLPATTLATNCYAYMFSGCTSLTAVPSLPATTLATNCYAYMFRGCATLTTAPELLATTLAKSCYQNMFSGCTSLTTAPALPATTLAYNCYSNMFRDCKSLTTAPTLPATTLAEYCYDSMFKGCTSLTTAPELPATTLDSNCYNGMFNGCTSLTTAPELPATTLAAYCYAYMFGGCTSLTAVPALPATTLASNCYRSMFNRCTSLTTPPSVLPATTLAVSCYEYMFEFTAISAIPRIIATTYATNSCQGMFDDIKTLNVYSTSGTGHTYGWTAPSSASSYCSGMFGSDDGESEWAKLDGSNFPNSGTPTDGTTYYFKTVA